MLRKIRIVLAVVFFVCITLLFLDFTGTVHAWLGWMAKVQFLPAVLALNVGVIALLVVLTLVFGRVYCSVICPLGVFQDVVSWLSGRRKGKKNRFSYSPAKHWLRYGVFGLFVVALVAGVGSFVALLAPYSAYGRMVQNLLAPLYGWGNNALAYLAERADSYAFYSTEVWMRSLPTFLIALLTFIVIVVLAWRGGRTYCNTICPVGTVLSFLARFAWFRPVIDTEKCISCKLCERRCKASCINVKEHTVDYSRCVACMDCIDNCKHGAIRYVHPSKNLTPQPPKDHPQPPKGGFQKNDKSNPTTPTPEGLGEASSSRRGFLAGAGLALGALTVKAQEKKVDGGLAVILDKKAPQRHTPIVPPGAQGLRHMAQHCTACQLCVSVCPTGVLRPSTDLKTLMQPESSYERGYCRPECTKCSEVCPAGAILKITPADKSAIQIGHAVWIKENCIPLTDGVECGNCARHCPTGAILMVPSDPADGLSAKIPVVNTERCIGCGACENLCPSRPFSAIYVEGHERHRVI